MIFSVVLFVLVEERVEDLKVPKEGLSDGDGDENGQKGSFVK